MIENYPVLGAKEVSNTTLKPFANLSSAVSSSLSKLSVVHFSKKVKPCSGMTYFVSRLPLVRAVSVLCSPTTLKFTPFSVRVLTSNLNESKSNQRLKQKKIAFETCS